MKWFSKGSIWLALFLLFLFFPLMEILAQDDGTVLERISARIAGPFHLRFIFQPLVAIILGIRDGKTDAQLGNPPYIFELFSNKGDRKDHLKKALKAVTTPLIVGILLDAIVQFNLFHKVHILGAFLVGAFLVGLPYMLARGIRNRLESKFGKATEMKEE